MNQQNTFDSGKSEAFAGKLMTALNNATLCLMMSLGHRTGLFDTMQNLPPSTSQEIAEHSGLNERYVREWLGAMVTSRIVEFNPETNRFSLPMEHAAFLTRPAGSDNMALFAQYISLIAQVEDDIQRCFQYGGGVPYSRYPRFHEVMREESSQSVVSALESQILPLMPGLNEHLKKGIQVLDVGCGSGRTLLHLARLFPNSKFTGFDLSREAIENGRLEASKDGLSNVEFVTKDLSDFHETAEPEAFDFITTFDAIHDQAKPLNVLKGIHRSLKPEGVYLMQDINGSSHIDKDIDHPFGTFLYTISCMHCMTVSLAQGGEGLGAMWGEEKTREYLQKAGFRSITTNKLEHDINNNWYVIKK